MSDNGIQRTLVSMEQNGDLAPCIYMILKHLYFDYEKEQWDFHKEWDSSTIEYVADALPTSAVELIKAKTPPGHYIE